MAEGLVIGITGKRLSGKSTAAGCLEERYGFRGLSQGKSLPGRNALALVRILFALYRSHLNLCEHACLAFESEQMVGAEDAKGLYSHFTKIYII